MTFHRNRFSYLAAGIAGLGLWATTALAAEFDLSPEQPTRVHAEKNEKAVTAIPKDYKFVEPGVLTVGINPWDPPVATYATDAKAVVGTDPDLAVLLAETLGLKLNLVAVAWEDWPLGLSSGKFDAVISNVTVTEERKEKFDFSTYRQDVLGFYVKKDSSITSIKEPKDVAGLKVITGAGTNQEKILLEWDRENVAAGLKPVEVQYYDDRAASQLAIQSGRADAEFNPNATLAYGAAVNGGTKLVGVVSGGWPRTAEIAVATRKGSGLADAFTVAVNELIASGKYGEVLKKWSLTEEAIDKSATNPLGLPKPNS